MRTFFRKLICVLMASSLTLLSARFPVDNRPRPASTSSPVFHRSRAKTAERELKRQNCLEALWPWRSFGPKGPSGMETLWAWRPFGPGGLLGLEAFWAWGCFRPGSPFGPGGPSALGALRPWGLDTFFPVIFELQSILRYFPVAFSIENKGKNI